MEKGRERENIDSGEVDSEAGLYLPTPTKRKANSDVGQSSTKEPKLEMWKNIDDELIYLYRERKKSEVDTVGRKMKV